MNKTLRIVFVCSGNICRSPLAEGLARQLFEEAEIPAVLISAGTLGLNGRSAAPHSVTTAAEIGVDLSEHRSQGVNIGLLRVSDRIVVMAPRHENDLLRSDASLRSKIVRLWEYAAKPGEPSLDHILDPVGKDLQTFRRARDLIQTGLQAWIDALSG